jgi:isocitrate dehydrogenase
MFEAIHGSAPRRAGQNVANPSGLLLGGVLMLNHIGQPEVAERVHNAWLRTLEDGIHTYDIFQAGVSTQKVGTREFADAVIARLGQTPQKLKPVHYNTSESLAGKAIRRPRASKQLLGVDIFLHWDEADRSAEVLGQRFQQAIAAVPGTTLKMISNRGVKVYPDGFSETFCTDHWRCRVLADSGRMTHEQVIALLTAVNNAGLDFIKTEHLVSFDGQKAYSLGQGE